MNNRALNYVHRELTVFGNLRVVAPSREELPREGRRGYESEKTRLLFACRRDAVVGNREDAAGIPTRWWGGTRCRRRAGARDVPGFGVLSGGGGL